MAVAGLYTTVKNVSGATAVFGFLGVHGKRLAHNATFTEPGDLVARLGNQRSQRQFKAFEKAIEAGDLTIVSSPVVYTAPSPTATPTPTPSATATPTPSPTPT
jgi:hypothetical protein